MHERLILARVDRCSYIVLTPDGDVFAEQLDSTNAELDCQPRQRTLESQTLFDMERHKEPCPLFRCEPLPTETAR